MASAQLMIQLVGALQGMSDEQVVKAVLDAAAVRDANVDAPLEDPSPAGIFVTITKADEILGVIYGVASAANLMDHEGDIVRPAEVRKAAHGFMRHLQVGGPGSSVNDTHKFGDIPGVFVESWVDDHDDWQIGFKPDDIEIAKAAARGEFVGWSIEGVGNRVEVVV